MESGIIINKITSEGKIYQPYIEEGSLFIPCCISSGEKNIIYYMEINKVLIKGLIQSLEG